MADQGYHKRQVNHCVFVKRFDGGHFLILLLYVDGMLIVRLDHINERCGSDKTDPRDAHCLGLDKDIIVVVTREVHDKGDP